MSEIRFVDTTLRDGHQSLWAEQMRTGNYFFNRSTERKFSW